MQYIFGDVWIPPSQYLRLQYEVILDLYFQYIYHQKIKALIWSFNQKSVCRMQKFHYQTTTHQTKKKEFTRLRSKVFSKKRFQTKYSVSPPSLRPRVKCCGWDGEWGARSIPQVQISLYTYSQPPTEPRVLRKVCVMVGGWWCVNLFQCSA